MIDMVTIRVFQAKVQDWTDIDDQLRSVLMSVQALRNRMWWESTRQADPTSRSSWQKCLDLHIPGTPTCLNASDIQLALSTDLLQHEKMMVTTRFLAAALSQAQDRIGRFLHEWMVIHREAPLSIQELSVLGEAQNVNTLLGKELCRKQALVSTLIKSTIKGLVRDEKKNEASAESPRIVAADCVTNWGSRDSALADVIGRMSHWQKLVAR